MPIEVLLALGLGTSIVGSAAAHGQQKQAAAATKEEKIRAYKYNIGRIAEETRGTVGDIQRGGGFFKRQQTAAMGAAGATIGTGTPLMNMLETEASIARDITRVQRAAALETEYYEEEIEALGGGTEEKTSFNMLRGTGAKSTFGSKKKYKKGKTLLG